MAEIEMARTLADEPNLLYRTKRNSYNNVSPRTFNPGGILRYSRIFKRRIYYTEKVAFMRTTSRRGLEALTIKKSVPKIILVSPSICTQ